MSTPVIRRQRWGGKTAAALAVSSVLAFSSVAGASASTLSPSGDSEGFAQLISSSLLNTELLDVATAHAVNPGGPLADAEPLDLSLLETLDLQLTDDGLIQIPLIGTDTVPGLLDLGQMGTVQSAAFAPERTSASAASGVVGDDGTISISKEDNPSDIGNATINVTALLSQLGVNLGGAIDGVAFEVGAVAARAEASEETVTTDYRVADLKATVDAPLVGNLVEPIRGAVDTTATDLTTALDRLVGEGSVLQDVLDVVPAISVDVGLASASVAVSDATLAVTPPNVSAVVDELLGGPGAVFVSDDESVTVDLVAGTVSIDLAEIVNPGGNGLNDLAPNTDVLTASTITKITEGVGNALGKVSAAVTAATLSALESAAVDISVPLSVSGTLLGLPLVNISGAVTIQGTLAEVLAGEATANVSFTGALGALLNPLLDAVTNSVLNPLLAALNPAIEAVLAESGTALSATIDGLVTPVVDALDPLLSGVLNNVARITINDQPTIDNPVRPADLGDGSYTVRALSVTLLPNLTGSPLTSVSLANATAFASPEAADIADVVITSPVDGAEVTPGDDGVPVTGTGEPGATVVVTTGEISTTTTVTDEGTWTTVLPGLEPGDHTITATQTVGDDTSTDSVTMTVVGAVPSPSPAPTEPGNPTPTEPGTSAPTKPAPGGTGNRPKLPNTGGDPDLALPGVAAVLVGAVCVMIGMRNRRSEISI